jgi:hypothetical protein
LVTSKLNLYTIYVFIKSLGSSIYGKLRGQFPVAGDIELTSVKVDELSEPDREREFSSADDFEDSEETPQKGKSFYSQNSQN